ncbi:MAG TPA: hypothetical protein VGK17_20260 [Propionicimonas sp.]
MGRGHQRRHGWFTQSGQACYSVEGENHVAIAVANPEAWYEAGIARSSSRRQVRRHQFTKAITGLVDTWCPNSDCHIDPHSTAHNSSYDCPSEGFTDALWSVRS